MQLKPLTKHTAQSIYHPVKFGLGDSEEINHAQIMLSSTINLGYFIVIFIIWNRV